MRRVSRSGVPLHIQRWSTVFQCEHLLLRCSLLCWTGFIAKVLCPQLVFVSSNFDRCDDEGIKNAFDVGLETTSVRQPPCQFLGVSAFSSQLPPFRCAVLAACLAPAAGLSPCP